MSVNSNVIFKTSETNGSALLWPVENSTISKSPGTIYFTKDGKIIYDLNSTTRLWMGQESEYAKEAEYATVAELDIYNHGIGEYVFGLEINDSSFSPDYKLIRGNGNTETLRTHNIIEFIRGTQNTATASWTGVTKSSGLYNGKHITYQLPKASPSTGMTLNLTLSGGTTTGAIQVVRPTGTYTTKNYPENTTLFLVYYNNKWYITTPIDDVNYPTWSVSQGGTGETSFTSGALLQGNGSNAISEAGTVGQDIQGIYLNNGVPTQMTYTLKANVDNGTVNYLAYYSADRTISKAPFAHFANVTGTTSVTGVDELVLGNATAAGANNNAVGRLALYSSGTKGTYLVTAANSTNSWYTATLQAKSGTVAYTSDITSSIDDIFPSTITGNKVVMTDGANKKLKEGTISTDTVIKTVTLSAGSTPTLGTAIAADDITAWDAGSTPTLGTAISVPNVTGNTSVSASKVTKTDDTFIKTISQDDSTSEAIGSVSGGVLTLSNAITAVGAVTSGTTGTASLVSITDVSASKVTLGTAISIPNITDVGSVPSLSYTARSIPNVTNVGSVPSITTTTATVVTGIS